MFSGRGTVDVETETDVQVGALHLAASNERLRVQQQFVSRKGKRQQGTAIHQVKNNAAYPLKIGSVLIRSLPIINIGTFCVGCDPFLWVR